ncbi:MAG: type IX secretion system membrane protein PorP/SprF [Bacteroidales bacterium]|nr:type IX secretion system membrane protein PorP/SprF [Bacteroidales bacterium]
MKKISIIFVLVLAFSGVRAQQEPLFSQYHLNPYLINPAYGGTQNYMPLRINARQQWLGIDGAPSTQSISFNTPIGRDGKIGTGAVIFNDSYGPMSKTGIQGTFAYKLKINEDYNLSFGLSVSVSQLVLDESNLVIINQNDAVINGANESYLIPDAGFGAWFYSKQSFIGFSAMQLLQYPLSLDIEAVDKQIPHFYVLAGHKFELNEKLEMEPSVLVKKMNPTPFQVDINLRMIMSKMYWVGLSFRTSDAAMISAGIEYQNFLLGYAYDYSVSALQTHNSGTHELMLGYNFKINPKTSVPVF